MEKLEYKSQICTSVEESKRLLELGLKKETADMTIIKIGEHYFEFVGKVEISCDAIRMNGEEIEHRVEEYIPAWSLHRLIELCGSIAYDWMSEGNNPYEDAINCLELLIKNDCYNKDYLEE